MLSKWSLFLGLMMVVFSVFAKDFSVKVRDEAVTIRIIKNGSGKNFVHLHQNETTALKAAKQIIQENHGQVITLIHSGKRNIVFHLNAKHYESDPNRMFSKIGIHKSLSQFGASSPKAIHEVEKLSNALKQKLPKGKIIAVHNNEFYSLKDYLPGHPLHSEAKALHYPDPQHYRNFYLVTQ